MIYLLCTILAFKYQKNLKFFKFIPVAIITLLFIFPSCKKAGTGGAFTIAAFPKHHTMPIKDAIIYIKYNAKDFPGDDVSVYDDSGVADTMPGEDPHVHFEGLKKGNYYLYSVGYDSTISQVVKGGIPVKINEKEGEIDVVVPVTE